MHDQYKTKVLKLTTELKRLEKEQMDSLELLRCREKELLARKDMLLWEKNNEKVQVGQWFIKLNIILICASILNVLNVSLIVLK